MAREVEPEGDARELRLEGFTLVLACGVLLAALYGAFALGREVERRSAPPRAAGTADPASREEQPEDATEKPTFFDTVTGDGKEAEPRREAASKAAPPAPPSAAPPASSGSWYVQVFVGRDRAAAEDVVRTLRGLGYPVRTDAVSEGSGSLYKVRVGGYATKELADAGAEKLHRDGQGSTWVVRLGG